MKTDAIKKKILNGMKSATKDVRDEASSVIHKNIAEFYNDGYTPVVSRRFYQIPESVCDDTPVYNTGNGYSADVHMMPGLMNHPLEYQSSWPDGTPFTVRRHWSEEKILDVVLSGSHGGRADGHPIWHFANEDIAHNYKDWYRSALRANGVPVK